MGIFNFIKKRKDRTINTTVRINTQEENNNSYINKSNNPENDFFIKYHNEISNYEGSIVNMSTNIFDNDDYSIQIDKLNKLISTFNNFEKFCCSKQGGASYFSSMWLHCHNSQNSDFSFITRYKEKLDYLLKNKIESENKILIEKNKINFEKTAEKELLKFISNNNGILQKDIYKNYPLEYKQIIQSTLYFMAKTSKIKREKQGNTYKIYTK